ncbi:MAG: hypothetical protein IPO40_18670 [Fibrobacteres bacterium]|nr:hypothetical protein [Fibrobacterota bacterium]
MDQATFCHQCGNKLETEPIRTPVPSAPKVNHNPAEAIVILGFIFLPPVFAWITLTKAYSKTARKLVFGWLAIWMAGIVISKLSSDFQEHSTQTKSVQDYKNRRNHDSVKIAHIIDSDTIQMATIIWYMAKSKEHGFKSPEDSNLIRRFCINSCKSLELELDSALTNKNALFINPDRITSLAPTCSGIDKGYSSLIAKYSKAKDIFAQREVKQEKEKEKLKEELTSTIRQEFASNLRQNYLDNNLDIKVFASGKNNTVLTLKYVLFNDVWSNKMQKGDEIDKIKELGFKKLIMTDGYDWSVYWTF